MTFSPPIAAFGLALALAAGAAARLRPTMRPRSRSSLKDHKFDPAELTVAAGKAAELIHSPTRTRRRPSSRARN